MPFVAKRLKAWAGRIQPGKQYSIDEALGLVREFAKAKFRESVDVAVNLGIDASKSDQQVRGSTVMRSARTGSTFEPPEPLFDVPGIRDFDTAHRSDRIIALLPARSESVDSVSVLLNWRSLLPADPDLARNRRPRSR